MPVWSVYKLALPCLGNINSNSESWSWNWNWNWSRSCVFQLLVTALLLGLGFLHLLRSNYLFFFSSSSSSSPSSSSSTSSAMEEASQKCAVCSRPSSKQCSRCKSIRYCSTTCQTQHWKSEHMRKCQPPKHKSLLSPSNNKPTPNLLHKVLFPYDQFLQLFKSDKLFPPCGLVNCGNSCFANVILQCLSHTPPLVAYLLDKGHRQDCRRNEWCFLCQLQLHMETATRCRQPFSPITILSRLPTIGSNLENGRQEDAHEFMRFAIDKMQSVCLDEHGGEKAIHPNSQQTTLIQHIFGGQLQSQVVCAQCNQVSRQYENMMDLTVEIQGDATSLEECLDQFTMKEWLHGDNLYKCDRCNDYVRAWKRLTIHQAPNILTIALKRFQSGRFGKINKIITFPEKLDVSPYMSEGADGTDIYKLYAVVVHVDMLNASFFGHYICYTKGFQGEWFRIDDCKVTQVELDEVLSQGAYMLMYSRVSARPTCLKTYDECGAKQKVKENADTAACDGSAEGLGFMNPVSALENGSDSNKAQTCNEHCGNGQSDVQHSSEVNVSCSTSSNNDAPIADSMSPEETSDGCIIMTNGVPGADRENVKQGYRCENEACVSGNENEENIAIGEEGREASASAVAIEETTCCSDVKDVNGKWRDPDKNNDGEDVVDIDLDDDAKVNDDHSSGSN